MAEDRINDFGLASPKLGEAKVGLQSIKCSHDLIMAIKMTPTVTKKCLGSHATFVPPEEDNLQLAVNALDC